MRLMHPRVLIGCLAAAALAGCHTLAQQPAPLALAPALPSGAAQVIYLGGDIVTLNDAQPSAQALAIRDGKILAVGPQAEIEKKPPSGPHPGGQSWRKNLDAQLY